MKSLLVSCLKATGIDKIEISCSKKIKEIHCRPDLSGRIKENKNCMALAT
jgi:hypothetical protein